MTLLTEEQREALAAKGVKAPFVNETCIGCGACVAISPDAFDLNDEGMSVVIAQNDYSDRGVDDSISACPVSAISWK
ncbi:MAG: ferredoxin [Candidatus Gracilibacteria bacterium]|nr:ferredoxin [Candidatus Gracilibacteria bacterium]